MLTKLKSVAAQKIVGAKMAIVPAALAVAGSAAYNATYVSDDVDDIAIDFVGTYGVQWVSFAGLVALAVIFIFFWSRFRGFGGMGRR